MRKLKLFFACLLMAVLSIGQVWATTFSYGKISAHNPLTSQTTDGVTLSWSAGTNTSNSPQHNKNGYAQLYANNILTVSVTSGNEISAITFEMNGSYTMANCKVGGTAISDNSWSGSSASVEITNTGTGQVQIKSITVTYASGTSDNPTLTSISVATAPTKTTYTAGETFDPTGLVITRNYSNSTNDTHTYANHTSEFSFEPSTTTALETSNTSVTITYNGQSTTQSITVNAAGGGQGGGSSVESFSWDLSKKTYTTGTNLVTWTSSYATMQNTTGSGTSATNYLGGDSNNRTSSRFYSGNALTITPASNVTISSIVFTATSENYATAFNGSTWTNASAAVSGSTVTVTPTNGANAISATVGGTCGFTNVTVYYTSTGGGSQQTTLSSIAVSSTPSKTTYEAGDAFDVTGLVVTGTYSDESQAAITEGITWTACKTENGSYVALDNAAVALAANETDIYVKATVGEITSAAFHVTSLTVTAAQPKITITQDQITDFTNSYAQYDWTAGGVSGKLYAYKNSGMQFNSGKTGYYVYNTNPIPGSIRKITMTKASGTTQNWTPYVSTSALTSTGGTALAEKSVESTTSWDVTGDNTYFYLTVAGGATVISSIVIEYETCQPLGSINGSVTLSNFEQAEEGKLKADWQLAGTTGIGSLKLQLWKKGATPEQDEQVGNDETVTVNTTAQSKIYTGLDYCTTYYVKLVATKDNGTYCTDGWTETSGEATTIGYAISLADTDGEVYDGQALMGVYGADKTIACAGETVTLTPVNEKGYHFASWSVNNGAITVDANNQFTMPASAVTVAATFAANTVPATITITPNTNATITASVDNSTVTEALPGATVTLAYSNLSSGYQFYGWTVTAAGDPVDVENNTFTMPSSAVTVAADIRQMVTVTFHNGSAAAYDTKQTYVGGTITLPTTPTSFDETNFPNFVGWAASNTGMVTSIPTLVDGTETISADADYWAVFSDAPTTTNDYKKIAYSSSLADGNYMVVAVGSSAAYAMKANIPTNKHNLAGESVSIEEDVISNTESLNVWAISSSNSNYKLKNGSNWASIVVDGNYTNLILTTSDAANTFSISANANASDAFVFTTTESIEKNQIEYYNSEFKPYNGQNADYPIYLFKQQLASTKWTTRAVAFVTISYDANGVDAQDYIGTLPASEQIESGNDYTVSTAVLSGRTGYNFIGWNTDAEAEVGLSSLTNVTSNTTLHAIWEAIPTHDVKFSVNGSVVTALTLNLQEGASITFPKATVPEGSDKKFVGWIEADSYSSNTAPTFVTSATVGNADKIYYAVFADVVTEGAYEKLTSTTGLAAGDKLVITDGTGQGMKAYASGNNVSATSITLNTNKDAITSLGDACELTLSGESGAWTLFDGVNYIYAAGTATSGSNHMKGKTTSDNACLWEITISNGTTTVKSKNNSYTPYMRYNPNTSNNNPLFSCYNNSTAQNAVTLFKKAANVYSDYVTTIAPLDHIKITTAPKTAYKVGETLDLTDMVVTAYYGEEEATAPNKAVTNYTVSIEAETALTTEHTSFTVTYTEGNVNKTTNQGIHVYELSGITVDAAPEQTIKTEYADGESFDKTKIVVTATWGPAEAQDKIVEAIAADDYTVTPDPLEYGTTTQVVISYQSVYATPITVTVNDRDNYVITWNVAGTTTTTKYYVDDDALVLKAAPEVPEGFEDGFEFMGWTSDETINNDGTEITYAKNGDQLTGATTFRAVFAKGETTNGYKLSSTAPADGETIIISRLVESTYYALSYDNSSLSTTELAVTNDFVANPADAVLWDIASATNGVFVFPKGEINNRIHINNKEFKVATGDTNGDIVFSDEDNDGAFIAARSDNARWIGGTNSNGFTYTDNVSNAVSLYIFKPYSLTNHSNYRFAPSTITVPVIGLAEGTYYGAQTVTITQEDNKPIYYTRNGGELTLYDNGIQLNDNEEVTIVAKAYDSGSNDYSAPVTATYTIIASIEAPTITPASSFIDSKTVEISHPMSETEGFALLYSFDDVEYTAYTEPVVITETKTVYVKATYHNLVAEASPVTYTKTAGTAYDKLTSADQLVVGMQFLIACGTNVAGKPNSPTAQTYLKAVGITTTEDKAFVADEDVQVFTLEGETGAWAFGIGNGKYLIPSGGDVKVSDTKTGAWSIAIASGTPTITCVDNNSNNNTLKYNSGANPTRFKTYNTGQTALTALYYQPYETAYTLTFDVDGTDNDKSVQIVTGFEYTITNNVFGEAPVGYESTNKWTDGTKQYSVGSKIVMNGNKTLTPCWKVVLNPDPEVPNVLDGNDIANNDLIVEHGETVTLSLTEQSPTMGVIRVTNGKVIIDNANQNPSANPVTLTSDSIDIDKNGVVEVKTAVTAPYFRFCAAPGQTSEAGELFGSNNISVAGDIYLDVQLDPTAVDASEWYGISAPFDVNIADGFFTTDGTQLVSNYHFQLWIYDPQKYSNGGRSWTRCTTGVMEANKAYLIGFDPSHFTTVPNVIRLKYAGTQLPSTVESLDIQQYSNGYGWNGVANPNFFNVNVNRPVQIFDNHSHNFLPAPVDETDYNFVATMPLFCQANGTGNEQISFVAATQGNTYEYNAPTRMIGERYSFRIQIRKPNSPYYDNQMYVRASEDALATFEEGKDMETLNETCSSSSAIIWTNAYGKHLAVEDAPLTNNQAMYDLTIVTPKAGTYVLRQANEVEGADLYVTYEGAIVWNLSLGDYELDLTRGTTTGYGLLLVAQPNQMPTGVENGELLNGENGVQKILLNGQLYILRDGHLYDAVGKEMK